MTRLLRAALLGFLLTLALGLLARSHPPVPGTFSFPSPAKLLDMKLGTAHQPFVRRQLVPSILRSVDAVTSEQFRSAITGHLEASKLIPPFLFDASEGESFDSFICLIVWFVCFTVFAWAFETEAAVYARLSNPGSGPFRGLAIVYTVAACLMLIPLLHNNYIYDPPTVCFSILTLRALRRERFFELVLLTILFSFNRETAFLIPGLTFFTWVHRQRYGTAVQQAAILSALYFAIACSLAFHYHHNLGSLAENNRAYLVHTYIHKNAKYAVAAILSLAAYTYAVVRCWTSLPPVLKAVQWFVPLWIFMHIMWGWPMEWRVFLEVYPGMLLTIIACWGILRPAIGSSARQPSAATLAAT